MKYHGWLVTFLFSLLMQINKRTEIAACGQFKPTDTDSILDVRIFSIYGNDTKHWPWHAAIYHQFTESYFIYKCGGTLVSSKFVLTAAQCVSIAAEDVSVSLGRQYLNKRLSTVPFIKLTEILMHPDYNADSFENDIAIVTLSTEVIFDSYVQPVCMWNFDQMQSEMIGKFGTVVGWSLTVNDETSNTLQQASMRIVTPLTCLRSDPELFTRVLSNTNFCAGTRNGIALCSVDSGGSMTFEENGTFYIRGILSIGARKPNQSTSQIMCDSVQYAVFTDVAQYLPWIEKIVEWDINIPDPCTPSPCGENTVCTAHNRAAECSCISPYIGDAYTTGCHPECSSNDDCSSNLSCTEQRCRDPCIGACGPKAVCSVTKHIPVCKCTSPLIGDAYTTGCHPECSSNDDCSSNLACIEQHCRDPCIGACGPNAVCSIAKHMPVCTCTSPYIGDAYTTGCRPECLSNDDCSSNMSCTEQLCRDPCIGACGPNAVCSVAKHMPVCTCTSPYIGDAYSTGCRPECVSNDDCSSNLTCKNQRCQNPCIGACGPNAVCSVAKHMPVCTCTSPYIGDAYSTGCRPECASNDDCSINLFCTEHRCRDPCIGACGQNAVCSVAKHMPVCSCNIGYEGDPTKICQVIPRKLPRDPCNPSPCGPNSSCRVTFPSSPVCSYNYNYYPSRFFGSSTESRVGSANPPIDPCNPSPCGPNSDRRIVYPFSAACTCKGGYSGSPPNCGFLNGPSPFQLFHL